MRCFACDTIVPDKDTYDSATGRYYCSPCLEPTNEVRYYNDRIELFQANNSTGFEIDDDFPVEVALSGELDTPPEEELYDD